MEKITHEGLLLQNLDLHARTGHLLLKTVCYQSAKQIRKLRAENNELRGELREAISNG